MFCGTQPPRDARACRRAMPEDVTVTVICPNCDARFRDPPAEISLKRPVQCGHCEHEWVRDTERLAVDAPSLAPDMETLSDDDQAIRTSLPVVVAGATETQEVKEPLFVDRPADYRARKGIEFLPVAGLACLGLAAALVTFNFANTSGLKAPAQLLAAAGVENSPLLIGKVETVKGSEDGIRQLIVRGEIANTTATEVPVPPIRLTMRGESNVRLYAWTVSAAKTTLKAGESSRFTAIAKNYRGDAKGVDVEFEKPAR